MPRETRERVLTVLERLFPPGRIVALDGYRRRVMRSGNGHLPSAERVADQLSSMSECELHRWVEGTDDPAALAVLLAHLVGLPDALIGNDSAATSLRARVSAATTDTSICLIALQVDEPAHYCLTQPDNAERSA